MPSAQTTAPSDSTGSSDPTDADRRHFRTVAQHVLTLKLTRTVHSEGSLVDALSALQSEQPAGPFPKLHTLQISGPWLIDHANLIHVLSLLPHTLSKLETTWPTAWSGDGPLLASVPCHAPSISELHLSIDHFLADEELCVLAKALREFSALRRFSSRCLDIVPVLTNALSCCSTLESLKFDFPWYEKPNDELGHRKAGATYLWKQDSEVLRVVDVPPTQDACAFLLATGRGHSLERISITGDFQFASVGLSTALEAVTSHSNLLHLDILLYTDALPILHALRPLSTCRFLEFLSLSLPNTNFDTPSRIDDAEVEHLCQHLTKLKHLTMYCSDLHSLTFRSLAAALKYCPELVFIGLQVNANVKEVLKTELQPHRKLRKMRFCHVAHQCCCTCVDNPSEVATFLSQVSFTADLELGCRMMGCCSGEPCEWRQVAALLPLLQRVRQQERRRVIAGMGS